jgi:hypothetical protein
VSPGTLPTPESAPPRPPSEESLEDGSEPDVDDESPSSG